MAIGSLFLLALLALGALAVVLLIVAIVKWTQSDRTEIGGVSRGLWLVLILLTSPIGPAIFLYMLSDQQGLSNDPPRTGQPPYGDLAH